MPEPGDVILAKVPFTDQLKVKKRPAVVLFKEQGNIVISGITSNTNMDGIPLTKEEGAVKESVIKLNYIFTISGNMVERTLFQLSEKKKSKIFNGLKKKLENLE